MNELREQVIAAFKPREGYTFSHVLPFTYTNFIDGMAWVSVLAGACKVHGDTEIQELSEGYLNNLILSGKDSRNFAPTSDAPAGWKFSEMPGYSYKEKPQAFAGPCALEWAIKQGCNIEPMWVKTVMDKAELYTEVSWLFGYLIKWIKPLRQHVNSVMFAHMLTGKRPPQSMHFLAENNMIYSWLYAEKCEANYPNTGIWPAKDWPGNKEEKKQKYTPICDLIGRYLQGTL